MGGGNGDFAFTAPPILLTRGKNVREGDNGGGVCDLVSNLSSSSLQEDSKGVAVAVVPSWRHLSLLIEERVWKRVATVMTVALWHRLSLSSPKERASKREAVVPS